MALVAMTEQKPQDHFRVINLLFDRPWKKTVWAGTLLLLLSILYTFPLVTHISTELPGTGMDVSQYYWCHWWFHKAVSLGQNPWHTDYLWYPNGSSLVFSTNRFGSAALGWLFTPLAGIVTSYNLVILLSFVISGLGFYLFVREWSGSDAGGLAAAVIFAFSPFKYNKLIYQHFLLSTYAFGFVLWMLVRILKGKSKATREGLILGLLLGITLYESIFCLDLLALAVVFLLLWHAVLHWKSFWRKEVLVPLLVAGLAAAVVAVPMATMIYLDLPEYGGLPQATGAKTFSNDLLVLFIPSPMAFSGPGTNHERIFARENFVYRTREENFGTIGWIILALGVSGWWIGRKKSRLVNSFAFGALLFAVLSLGPVLHIAGKETFDIGPLLDVQVPLPYALLQPLPPVGMVRAPSRFILLTFFFLAPLAAMSVTALAKKAGRLRILAAAAVLTLLVFAYFPRGIVTTDPNDVPEPVRALAEVEGGFAVIPLNLKIPEHMKYAPVHGKPQTAGYVSRGTLFSRPLQYFSVRMLSSLAHFAEQHPDSARLESMRENVSKMMKAWNLGAILYKGEDGRPEYLSRLLGGRVASRENDLSLILLPTGGAPDSGGLSITPENWPRMPQAGLDSGVYADAMITWTKGFRICVPDGLMPRGEISIAASSAIRSIPRRDLHLRIYFNRIRIGTLEPGDETTRKTFRLPPGLKRLPVNLITVRPELPPPAQPDAAFPFVLEAVSGNPGAASRSAVFFEGKEILPYAFRGGTLSVAIFRARPAGLTLLESLPLKGGDTAHLLNEVLDRRQQGEWAVIAAAGRIAPAQAEEIAAVLSERNCPVNARQLRGSSFVALLSDTDGRIFIRKQGLLSVLINTLGPPASPVANIESLTFR